MKIADEDEELKKTLDQADKKFNEIRSVANSFKAKYEAEAKTANNLRITISQHVIEKKILHAKFEEAM